ncbi:hypothetical protein AB834_04085 [PVC group bacterium (ex Bugula neritina AB1)]|nr:hypothetical protein AB834_04085 [PVC group bacterium (ex Bugula neritina AB1)]
MKKYDFSTEQIHSFNDNVKDSCFGETTSGPVQSSAFAYPLAKDIANVFAQRQFGYIYSRIANPTVHALEQRINALEKGLGTVAVSSGMAAVSCALLTILKNGDEFVCGNSLFGGCFSLFNDLFPRFGINPVFVEASDVDAYEKAVTAKTKAIFFEVIGNPKIDVPSVRNISKIAKKYKIPLVLDNTVATPWLFTAKDHGADIIVHSTSKYINGHGNAIGGSITDCGTFDFHGQKFEEFEPFLQKFGAVAFLAKLRKQVLINMGPCLSPQNAFLQLTGLETLSVRMKKHSENALKVAQFLENHDKVLKVHYAGLSSSPWHLTAVEQFGKYFGGLLSFDVGTRERAFSLIDKRDFISNLANIGDAKTLIIHPDSTIYADHSEEQKKDFGVTEGLVRLSVGLESSDDIIRALDSALQ